MKKRAALCLLKMIRKTPADQQVRDKRGRGKTRRLHACSRGAAKPLGQAVGGDPISLLHSSSSPPQVVNPDSFVPTLNDLLEERDPGLLLSAVTLLSGILARNGPGEGTEREVWREVRAR